MNPIAVITGASRGIGKEIATLLASKGCDLVLCCQKSIDQLSSLAETLQTTYAVSVRFYQGNVADPHFAETLFADLPRVDYLINNAGISQIKLLTDTSYEEWKELMGVNVDGVFLCSKAAAKLMLKEHRGHILNISSMWGQSGASMEVAYSSSKGAVDAFTKALAKELAPSGIQVNALSLGFIDTEMNKHLSDEEREAFFDEIPSGRPGDPKEAAAMAWQILTSPPYLTGQVIRMDGGLL
ncbi:MAG: SDR family NAD(P)-dependent oxidoreductase [Lachnospiraceae bacterium]|nr:SDR family NAD(P)-dependent oxidoreductase [Lachnospiraceae bacterium]